jgi:hypothetical protein
MEEGGGRGGGEMVEEGNDAQGSYVSHVGQ